MNDCVQGGIADTLTVVSIANYLIFMGFTV